MKVRIPCCGELALSNAASTPSLARPGSRRQAGESKYIDFSRRSSGGPRLPGASAQPPCGCSRSCSCGRRRTLGSRPASERRLRRSPRPDAARRSRRANDREADLLLRGRAFRGHRPADRMDRVRSRVRGVGRSVGPQVAGSHLETASRSLSGSRADAGSTIRWRISACCSLPSPWLPWSAGNCLAGSGRTLRALARRPQSGCYRDLATHQP